MRIKNTIKNSLYAVVSYLFLAVLAIFVRKAFLRTLPVELLGYEGLFGNVFSLLGLADLGIETVILYRLFPAFARQDKDEINRIMCVYRYLYRIVGIVVLLFGVILSPFLRYIISGNNYQWNYVYIIYFIQLIMTLSSYFLAYKRLMFTVSQQEYECTKVDTAVSFAFNLLRLITLLFFKNYLIYLLCNLGSNLVGNIVISRKVDKSFHYFQGGGKTTFSDVKALNIGKDIKNNLFQKVCGTIYGGTDNIVISAFLGISQVGILTNYLMISSYVTTFITKILRPFQMSIGNYIYENSNETGYKMFRMFDFISFLIASVVTACYYCLFNPTINLLFGNDYLLSQNFVLVFSINQYIMWNHQFLTFYRYSFGRYEMDRFPIFIAAFLNLTLSIVLSKPLGMTGIMLGTVIGHLGFWYGRMRVVYAVYITEGHGKYLRRQIIRIICCAGEVFLVSVLCKDLSITIGGLIVRLFLGLTIPCLINLVIFWHASEMRSAKEYFQRVINLILQKGKN